MFSSNRNNTISFVAQLDNNVDELINKKIEGNGIPLLALRDQILAPGTVLPVNIGREISRNVVKNADKNGTLMVVVTQKTPTTDIPLQDDLYETGTIASVVHLMKVSDGNFNILLQGLNRVRVKRVELVGSRRDMHLEADVVNAPVAPVLKENALEYETIVDMIRQHYRQLADTVDGIPDEMVQFVEKIHCYPFLINFIIQNLPMEISTKMDIMEMDSEEERAIEVLRRLKALLNIANLRRNIEHKTRMELDKQQRDYYISQEIRNLQSELGNGDENTNKMDDIAKMRLMALDKEWSSAMALTFDKELNRLSRINAQSPDYNIQLNYVQTILQLPWDHCTKDSLNMKTAERVLNHDHYGMEKVKERILEHLAVLKLRGDQKSPIICLYGPPGVGKTSLGKSIARALKRNYVRISLGGMHDESEIRGHRRTYIGAMPGRIIKGIIKAGSSNPVFILDEIDKITQNTHNGDPSSAMLEVLDPEQNNAFHDNYLDIDYDLSRVMFIATANDINTIPRPLLDRMELIEVGGYITEEKIEIAKRHLVPKEKEKNGMADQKDLKLSKDALEYLIERYTRESGVRGLEKQINKIFRKLALMMARNEELEARTLPPEAIQQILGKPIFNRDKYQGNDTAGVVTGLAWTSVGGEILFIETSLSRGKGGRLTLTGNLGDVMKESAMLALEYIKAHADNLNIDMRIFENYNIHIHVPEGAVPKDGPSAGITMATSIASALTQRKVRKNLAMTGEITLRGKVLPVGGIKEKILAAKRAGITDLILCMENKKDIEEIPDMYLNGLTFHYVDSVMDVWNYALLDEKVKDAIEFKLENNDKKNDEEV
ncbi:MAG: endopeptidase La [Bacteroidaceae bacterium]|nr:endopeptidase La [Bacteroidaceae bacterium]